MRQSLPGITKVAYVDCESLLPDVTLRALAQLPIIIPGDSCPVSLSVEATCETVTQFDNNSLVEKSVLTFYTLDEVPIHRHLAFVICTANNETFLIGTKEQPFPTAKLTSSTGNHGLAQASNSIRHHATSSVPLRSVAFVPCSCHG